MKDELGGMIVTEFAPLRPKTYSYIMDDGNNDKKAKGTKKDLKGKHIAHILKKLIRLH